MRRCVVQHDMHLSVLFSEDPVRFFQCRLWQRLHPNHITVGQNQAIQHPLAVSTHSRVSFMPSSGIEGGFSEKLD